MADTTAHNKQVEYFMGAEVGMPGVENWELQRIDDTAYGIDDSAC